jgi:hypothetical protein
MVDGDVLLDLDKLPIKRLEAIDEAGNEHYPPYAVCKPLCRSLKSTLELTRFSIALCLLGCLRLQGYQQ